MTDTRLSKHLSEFDILLRNARERFDNRWQSEIKSNASMSEFSRVRTLGTGSFGRVMLVKHKSSQTPYAMKIMEKGHIVKMNQVHHTLTEIRVLNSIKFEFIVGMEHFFRDNVYIYLTMPYVNGGEMFTHLRQMRKFDETLTRFYASQVVMAFEYLHFLGLVYRDLKPENILLDQDGYIKLTDLGFCKWIGESRTYTLCGTPEYLAPEVILTKGYNKAVDWWALGVLIFEMAAGYPPFFAKDAMRVYEKIVTGRISPPAHFSKDLRDLLHNMLQVDLSKRYGNLKHGSKDIKGHGWFRNLDWDGVLYRKIKPSFVPKVKGVDDSTNFDEYEEAELRFSEEDEYDEIFDEIAFGSLTGLVGGGNGIIEDDDEEEGAEEEERVESFLHAFSRLLL